MRALLSMVFSLAVIIGYIIPHILAGEDPLLVSIIGSVILLGVTLYLTYGWNMKSHSAVLSMVLVLLLTGALSGLFVIFARLNGTGDENSMFLIQSLQTSVNLRGLLLGGYIIGALGVLDDLVTTQASAVVTIWQWCRLTKRLSICRSLSGVRPTMVRPSRSGSSPTVRPSAATTSLASAGSGRAVSSAPT